jgi:predicted secreted protein
MMPVQLLLVLAVAFFVFIVGQYFLKKIGRPLPVMAQAALIWFTAYAIFKIVVQPPLPSSLITIYMGLLTVVVFILISSTNRSWDEFKQAILDTLTGATGGYRLLRAVVVVLIPVLTGLGTYNYIVPSITDEPVELRNQHTTPPASITVFPPEYFMKK